jgi:hypothetical protein
MNAARLMNVPASMFTLDPMEKMERKLWDAGLAYPIPRNPFDPEPYYAAGVLRKEQLIRGRWYWGLCRNAAGDLALWDGYKFMYLRFKFHLPYYEESIEYFTDDPESDVFVPFEPVVCPF